MYACIHLPRASEGEHSRLSALAQAFSPKVEITAPDTAVIDVAPLRRLFGGPDKIASEIAREAHKMKLEGNIAIAANPDIAILAARNLPGVTILPPGEEGDILADQTSYLDRGTVGVAGDAQHAFRQDERQHTSLVLLTSTTANTQRHDANVGLECDRLGHAQGIGWICSSQKPKPALTRTMQHEPCRTGEEAHGNG